VCVASQSGGPLSVPSPQCSVPDCQQGVTYDSDRYSSRSKSPFINQSQCSEHRVDLGQLPSRDVTLETGRRMSTGRRTVSDLLRTLQVQNADWSMVSPKHTATVDGFLGSVLGHNSASTDSGLQVNDSVDFEETPPKMLSHSPATDNHNNVMHSVAGRKDPNSQQSQNVMKSSLVAVESAASYEHSGYVQDRLKVDDQFSAISERPKLCSVAVNTSFYWPPDQNQLGDSVPVRNDTYGVNSYDQSTAEPVGDDRIRCHIDSHSIVTSSPRPLVSGGDIELVGESSPGTGDSMADVSMCTPPPPVFPNQAEESIASEMIMDMPEYTALSQDRQVQI